MVQIRNLSAGRLSHSRQLSWPGVSMTGAPGKPIRHAVPPAAPPPPAGQRISMPAPPRLPPPAAAPPPAAGFQMVVSAPAPPPLPPGAFALAQNPPSVPGRANVTGSILLAIYVFLIMLKVLVLLLMLWLFSERTRASQSDLNNWLGHLTI